MASLPGTEHRPPGRHPRLDRRVLLVLVLLLLWYLVATLPYLGDSPLLDWPQAGILAPAHKLASTGIYGNDLFAGYYRSQLRNYEYLPAYPLLVAAAFELGGLGVAQARMVSVLLGLATLALTFELGRRLSGTAVGLVAVGLFVFLQLGIAPADAPGVSGSGVPLLDFARLVRYDILVPVGVLGASLLFLSTASERGRVGTGVRYLLAGLLAAVATLANAHGVFILAVLAVVLVCERGLRAWRSPPLYLIAVGWVLGMLPWLFYVLQDVGAYAGQMSRHAARLDLFDLRFYWDNLRREPGRYAPWLASEPSGLLPLPGAFPNRLGVWCVLFGVPLGLARVFASARRTGARGERLLLAGLPLLALLMALFLFMKRHVYTLLPLPFLMLLLAWLGVDLWRRSSGSKWVRGALLLTVSLVIVEGGWGVARARIEAARATPYLELCSRLAAVVPEGARVLISQPYWLGLEKAGRFELRSLHLLHLARLRALGGSAGSTAEAMERLRAEWVIVEDYFLEPGSGDLRAPQPAGEASRVFAELKLYLDRRCTPILKLEDESYGDIGVYSCVQGVERTAQKVATNDVR